MRGVDDLDQLDRDALQRAMTLAMRDPEVVDSLQTKLTGNRFIERESWFDVAAVAAYHCQIRALHLKPWQEPPASCDEDDPHERDKQGQRLLRRMLKAGLSRYDPDPRRALLKRK